jgi:hypothetical protein
MYLLFLISTYCICINFLNKILLNNIILIIVIILTTLITIISVFY